jgi:hypothetical protein
MTVETHIGIGRLPAFWDRNAIFFANLLSLFFGNRGQTEELARLVGGLDTYGGRLLPVINLLFRDGDNLLVLERPPLPELVRYFRDVLGLSLPAIATLEDSQYASLYQLVDHSADEGGACPSSARDLVGLGIRSHPAPWVDGFVTDEQLERVAAALGKSTISSRAGSERGNNKLLLHQHLQEQGLPVFDTVLVHGPAEVGEGLRWLRRMGYAAAVLKSQVGASGIGLLKLATDDSHLAAPAHLFHEGPALLQGWLDDRVAGVRGLGSPSVQLFLDDTSVTLYDLTDQILSADCVHEGNLAPPRFLGLWEAARDEIVHQAAVAGQWLHAQGYRGTGSADFLVIERDGRAEVRVCEINARVTGATYPAVLARHFQPNDAWLMRNLKFRAPLAGDIILDRLDAAGLLFRPGLTRGVLPINFNLGADRRVGKGQFLFVADTAVDCETLLDQARDQLPVAWEFDRD